ncbi:putative gustatory receptor 28b [Odontomachus brunneus]|uniref:putative gustatory receptor 28b n=1 Tax=Odontomachus brunneus TaxID=486640 RepID=UPI0013F2ADBD|nr:putative gustatory receptor 28b [Odontomachus brunneus]
MKRLVDSNVSRILHRKRDCARTKYKGSRINLINLILSQSDREEKNKYLKSNALITPKTRTYSINQRNRRQYFGIMKGITNARNLTRIFTIFGNVEKVGFVVEKVNKQKATMIKSRSYQDSSWPLRMLIIFFKFVGLATFTYCVDRQKRTNLQTSYMFQYSELGIAYNIVLISLIIAFNSLGIPYTINLDYPNKTNMTVGIEIFQALLGSIAICVILLSYCFREKNLLRIGNRLTDVKHELDRLYRLYPSLRRERVFRVLTIVCIFNGSMVMTLLIVEYFAYYLKPISLLTNILPAFHLGWFMIQYFLLVTIIQMNFADVNRAIQCLARVSPPDFQPQTLSQTRRIAVGNSTVHQLLDLRDVHGQLCDVSQDVSDFYSVSMLFAISYMFFSIVYNGYYLISPLLLNDEVLEYMVFVDTVLWLIFLIYPILLLTSSITKLLNEMARTGNAINNLMSCMTDKEARFELQQISLQLLHRKVYFTASGYFTLDNTLFHSMLSAVTTYLVILAQFQLGNSSRSLCNCTQQSVSHMNE